MKAEPFSHTILVRDIPAAGRHVRVEADESERRGLAAELDLINIEALAADLEIRPVAGRAFSVRGTLEAIVVQTDVVTLDPVRQEVTEGIDVTLMPAEAGPRS